ncbi:MAG: AzlC family ABC transporter permease [Acidimicrobiales bacterium]
MSVGVPTGAYGVSFGALSVAAGLSVTQTCILSLAMFTGGSQFAFIGVVGAGGAPVAAVAAATLLGVRNGFYALAMAPLLRVTGWRRLAAAHLTIDESAAVATAQLPDRDRVRDGFWATGICVFIGWNATTFLGAVAGSTIGDPRAYGLDAAAAAAFLALLWPRLNRSLTRGVAVAAAAVATIGVPVTPVGVPVLAAIGVALVATAIRPDPVPDR